MSEMTETIQERWRREEIKERGWLDVMLEDLWRSPNIEESYEIVINVLYDQMTPEQKKIYEPLVNAMTRRFERCVRWAFRHIKRLSRGVKR